MKDRAASSISAGINVSSSLPAATMPKIPCSDARTKKRRASPSLPAAVADEPGAKSSLATRKKRFAASSSDGVVAVLPGEHELVQRALVQGEADVRACPAGRVSYA